MTSSEKGHTQKTREMDHQVHSTKIYGVVKSSILIQVGERQQAHVGIITLVAIGAINAALRVPFALRHVGST